MLSSGEIWQKWGGIAAGKAKLPAGKCFLLAALAGLYIALGAVGCTAAQANLTGGAGKLAGASVFPVGLILVVLAGAELFTGNCLMAGPAAAGKAPWRGVLRNWGVVYLGNFAGALLAAGIMYAGGFLQGTLGEAAAQIARNKCALGFFPALVRGAACNILVCGAVWMASGAESAGGKAACCFFPVMLFVLCGFEHSVANMYYIPAGMLAGAEETAGDFLLKNLLPVTLGNILGGAGFSLVYMGIHHEQRSA
ncbi:MAG: formate/nitrite transporter family protein [Clostridia bacterium]|nr:formate/nitrite transporter family protein [Clostridia bacterium]